MYYKYQNHGFALNNVIGCCDMCFNFRQEVNHDKLLKIAEHIATRYLSFKYCKPKDDSYFNNYNGESFRNNKYHAQINKINHELTYKEYNTIAKQECYVCGKENSDNHVNGIDIIDKKLGYTLGNCSACCQTCYSLKGRLDIFEFINMLFKIYTKDGQCVDNIKIDPYIRYRIEQYIWKNMYYGEFMKRYK